jgi:hypothetical protein
MPRTIWFSLICLIAVAALALGRALLPTDVKEAPHKMAPEAADSAPPAAKSDKLPTAERASPNRVVVVKTIRIAVNPKATEQKIQVASNRHTRRAHAEVRRRRHHSRDHRRHRMD